ncbi:porin family protein [Flavitalea flava]
MKPANYRQLKTNRLSIRKSILPVVLVLIATFGSGKLKAQQFSLGLKAGANFSNFTGGDFQQAKKSTLVGFMGGAYVGFQFGDHLSLQPEVLFSTQGAKFENTGVGKQDYKLSYINVPVMVKYRFTGGFYLEIGPQVGFKVSESTPDNTISHFAKDLDLSAAGGIGYQSPIGLGIGARYTAGLTKVGDFDASTASPNFKNGVAQVFVFYNIFNNKK